MSADLTDVVAEPVVLPVRPATDAAEVSVAARAYPWRLRRRIATSGLVLSAVLLVIVAVLAVTGTLFAVTTNQVIYRWQRAVAVSYEVFGDLANEETGLRGYELGRQTLFLQPYEQYKAELPKDQARLSQLIGDNARLQALNGAVNDAATDWTRIIVQPQLATVEARGTLTPADVLSGKHYFDRIRAKVATLRTALIAESTANRSTRTKESIVLIVAVSLAVVVLAAGGWLIWRGLKRWVLLPVDLLAGQTRVVAGGDTYRRIEPAGPQELVGLGADVEAMRRRIVSQLDAAEEIQDELRVRGEELARSNDDLQQFAYVASHDLSEPLRKVANFCQLLERQYGPELDDRARQYIDFAVDGSKRMQALITDLLALSRVGRTSEGLAPRNMDKKLDAALATLTDRIAATGATVERLTPLPVVLGDRSLLVSLWENLIGNAIKYHRDGVPPVVRISAEHQPDRHRWLFTVSDNGIGIDQQYADKIFAVFQRLHLRDRYGGTGIGLALCRRIVEFHGGQIWLADVESDAGATFRFTLQESGERA